MSEWKQFSCEMKNENVETVRDVFANKDELVKSTTFFARYSPLFVLRELLIKSNDLKLVCATSTLQRHR